MNEGYSPWSFVTKGIFSFNSILDVLIDNGLEYLPYLLDSERLDFLRPNKSIQDEMILIEEMNAVRVEVAEIIGERLVIQGGWGV